MIQVFQLFNETVMITSFVMVMMLMIEIVNVKTQGNWGTGLHNSRFKQLFFAVGIGLIPGCLGPYAVVSLYTHNIIKLGSLVAASIASTGDEAFVMLSMFPMKALFLFAVLTVISIAVGLLVNYITGKKNIVQQKTHLHIHQHETGSVSLSLASIKSNLTQLSFSRAILAFGLVAFMVGIVTGGIGHEGMHSKHEGLSGEDWVNLSFVLVTLFTLWAVCAVSQHFLDEHLWGHIVKKHFLRVFLWTLGALLAIQLLTQYVNFDAWVSNNQLTLLLLALLVGVLPVSGPHLLFVTLFAQGTIPFSILLANSIVQDGHGGLPLLAESKRSFLILKTITVFVGAVFGLAGIYMGF